MYFDQFVKKHTKALFTFILIAMAVPLVINFGPGGGCGRSAGGGQEAGVIFDRVPVTAWEHADARAAAFAYHRWQSVSSGPMAGMRDQIIKYLMRPGSKWNDPK